jgi:hypothetical protein
MVHQVGTAHQHDCRRPCREPWGGRLLPECRAQNLATDLLEVEGTFWTACILAVVLLHIIMRRPPRALRERRVAFTSRDGRRYQSVTAAAPTGASGKEGAATPRPPVPLSVATFTTKSTTSGEWPSCSPRMTGSRAWFTTSANKAGRQPARGRRSVSPVPSTAQRTPRLSERDQNDNRQASREGRPS